MVNPPSAKISVKRTILPIKEFHDVSTPSVTLSRFQFEKVALFNAKVEKGEIQFEETPCLCGSLEFDLIASVDSRSFKQDTVICRGCGLIQLNPRMTEDEYKKFYSSDLYRETYEGAAFSPALYQSRYVDATGRHIHNELVKHKTIDRACSVAEIGAGGGWNLLPFMKKGATVVGFDYSRNLVGLGTQHGIGMKLGGVEEMDDKYDVIVVNHVLEHFLDPIASLKRLVEHLRPDGVIYIAVPNFLNFSGRQFQNAHTYCFTPRTFKHYCSKGGLSLLEFGSAQKIHMFGIFNISADKREKYDLSGHYREMVRFFRRQTFRGRTAAFLKSAHLYNGLRQLYGFGKKFAG